jgi:hypothetical protein
MSVEKLPQQHSCQSIQEELPWLSLYNLLSEWYCGQVWIQERTPIMHVFERDQTTYSKYARLTICGTYVTIQYAQEYTL